MSEFKEVTREQINDRVEELVRGKDYPSYMRKPSLVTLYSGYIPITQTPNERIMDIAHRVAKIHNKPELYDAVYQLDCPQIESYPAKTFIFWK